MRSYKCDRCGDHFANSSPTDPPPNPASSPEEFGLTNRMPIRHRGRAAKVAENTKDGYTSNVRTSLDEQEFSKHKDGPWVLNADVATAIRKKKITAEEASNGKA